MYFRESGDVSTVSRNSPFFYLGVDFSEWLVFGVWRSEVCLKKKLSSVLNVVASEFGKTAYATNPTAKSNATYVETVLIGFPVRKAFHASKPPSFFVFRRGLGHGF